MSDRAGVRVVCHRGFNRVAPENTLAAANRAIAVGAHFVELDLRQSRDGVLYVMHDPTVDRSTNGSGVVSELTSLQIDRLDAGSWFGPQFRGEPVPRLGTFLRAVAGRTGVYVEIKDADPRSRGIRAHHCASRRLCESRPSRSFHGGAAKNCELRDRVATPRGGAEPLLIVGADIQLMPSRDQE